VSITKQKTFRSQNNLGRSHINNNNPWLVWRAWGIKKGSSEYIIKKM